MEEILRTADSDRLSSLDLAATLASAVDFRRGERCLCLDMMVTKSGRFDWGPLFRSEGFRFPRWWSGHNKVDSRKRRVHVTEEGKR